MDSPVRIIRDTRKKLGLSQTDLSAASGVSLPTIQNIEAGRANPSLSTLQSVLDALGLRARYESASADWNYLSACGIPILTSERSPVLPSVSLFLKELRRAALELSEDSADDERKREALQSCLLALKIHFPTFYERQVAGSALLAKLIPAQPNGRLLKLKRLAESKLSTFL